MKTQKFFLVLAILVMAVIFSSCSTTMKVATDGHHILTQEIMDNPSFNNTEKLRKIQWFSGAEIVIVRSYETTTDTVIDGQYITSVINIDTVRIPSLTSGVLVSPNEMGIAFEDTSSYLKFTPNKEGKYILSAEETLRYGYYDDWKVVTGGDSYLLFDLIKSEEVKTGRVVAGMRVETPSEE